VDAATRFDQSWLAACLRCSRVKCGFRHWKRIPIYAISSITNASFLRGVSAASLTFDLCDGGTKAVGHVAYYLVFAYDMQGREALALGRNRIGALPSLPCGEFRNIMIVCRDSTSNFLQRLLPYRHRGSRGVASLIPRRRCFVTDLQRVAKSCE
jgi:hypothetical protein